MNKPVAMTQAELVVVLEDVLERVRTGDSFEGSLEYLMPQPAQDHEAEIPEEPDNEGIYWCGVCNLGNANKENLEKDHKGDPVETKSGGHTDFMVRASYRIGNSQGQGGMQLIGDM